MLKSEQRNGHVVTNYAKCFETNGEGGRASLKRWCLNSDLHGNRRGIGAPGGGGIMLAICRNSMEASVEQNDLGEGGGEN